MIFQEESSDIDKEPSYLCDAELDDETIGKALSCSLRNEKKQRTEDKLITLMKKVCCPSSAFFRTHKYGETRIRTQFVPKTKVKSPKSKTKESGVILERQKEQILAEVRSEIQKHEFHADCDRRSIQELNGIIESQRREIAHTIAGDEQLRRDQLLLHEQLSEQNRDLREAEIKSLYEMEEMKRVKSQESMNFREEY